MGYEDLAAGIIARACDDYRESRKLLAQNAHNIRAADMMRDAMRFFRSQWFSFLSPIPYERLIKLLDAEEQREQKINRFNYRYLKRLFQYPRVVIFDTGNRFMRYEARVYNGKKKTNRLHAFSHMETLLKYLPEETVRRAPTAEESESESMKIIEVWEFKNGNNKV